MHLGDAFIQSDLQGIQAIHLYCQYVCSLGIEPTTFKHVFIWIFERRDTDTNASFRELLESGLSLQAILPWNDRCNSLIGGIFCIKIECNVVYYFKFHC